MLNNLISNLKSAKTAIKLPKIDNFSMPKYLELKYTLLPLAIIILLVFLYADTPIENYVLSLSAESKSIFSKLTDFGKADWMINVCIIILVIRLFLNRDKFSDRIRPFIDKATAYVCFILSAIIIGGVLGQILKFAIGRARPKFFIEHGSTYFEHFQHIGYDFASMPSGHSTTIGSLFACLFFIFPKLRYLWLILAIFFATTRIMVSAHYPSDVIFGLSFGTYTSIFIYYWMKNRKLI